MNVFLLLSSLFSYTKWQETSAREWRSLFSWSSWDYIFIIFIPEWHWFHCFWMDGFIVELLFGNLFIISVLSIAHVVWIYLKNKINHFSSSRYHSMNISITSMNTSSASGLRFQINLIWIGSTHLPNKYKRICDVKPCNVQMLHRVLQASQHHTSHLQPDSAPLILTAPSPPRQ